MPYLERSGVDESGNPVKVRIPLSSRVGDIVFSPIGTPREGTLVCDGSAVSRQAYAKLFDLLGTACGEGDGSTTFNLPDLRDVWILCAGTEHEAGESVAEGLPNITGQIRKTGGGVAIITISSGQATVSGALSIKIYEDAGFISTSTNNLSARSIDFDASGSNPIYGASDHVTPASVAVLPCIIYE